MPQNEFKRRKLHYKLVHVLKPIAINEIPSKCEPKWKFLIPDFYKVENNINVPNVPRIFLEGRPIKKNHRNPRLDVSTFSNQDSIQGILKGDKEPFNDIKVFNHLKYRNGNITHQGGEMNGSNKKQRREKSLLSSSTKPKYQVKDLLDNPDNKRPSFWKDTPASFSTGRLSPNQTFPKHVAYYDADMGSQFNYTPQALGYNWVRRYIEDADNSILWQTDEYFESLRKFREANKDECICPDWKGDKCSDSLKGLAPSSNTPIRWVYLPKDYKLFIPQKILPFDPDSLALSRNCSLK